MKGGMIMLGTNKRKREVNAMMQHNEREGTGRASGTIRLKRLLTVMIATSFVLLVFSPVSSADYNGERAYGSSGFGEDGDFGPGAATWLANAHVSCANEQAFLTWQYIDPQDTAIINVYARPGTSPDSAKLYYNYWLATTDGHDEHAFSISVDDGDNIWRRGEVEKSVSQCLRLTHSDYCEYSGGCSSVRAWSRVEVHVEGISYSISSQYTVGFSHESGDSVKTTKERGFKAGGEDYFVYNHNDKNEHKSWNTWTSNSQQTHGYSATGHVNELGEFVPSIPGIGGDPGPILEGF